MNVVVVEDGPSDLERRVWTFWFFTDRAALVLDGYREETRPTKRHKWRSERAYHRLNTRSGEIRDALDVPITPAIKALAMREFMRQVTVRIWPEVSPRSWWSC